MRWDAGFLCGGAEFDAFWSALAGEAGSLRRGLFIAGRGFDPRTTVGATAVAQTGFPIEACRLIRLTNPQDSPDRPRSQEAANNEAAIREVFADASFEMHEVTVRDTGGRLIGSAQVQALFADRSWLAGFTDIIVDISALPTSVSFPLIGTLIAAFDDLRKQSESTFNLHCIVCENANIDENIVAEGGDVAQYIDPFRGRGGLAADPEPTTIWAPVLGEGQSAALRKIREVLGPHEVKPFLPSPSRDPRRGDDLIAEYHSLLFDTWEVEPRGFIYADEQDPFDIYRQLGELDAEYNQSLKPLGPVRTVVSAHSSKLLSLGVLLAAYEHKLAIAHVEPTGYSLEGAAVDLEANELFTVWLTGEAYVSE